MQPVKRGNIAGETTNITLKTVQTGLFVDWEKSGVLIGIVQQILRTQYLTVAECGPRQPNNTCQIILRSLQPSGAKFADSKELLEKYLFMVKERKPGLLLEKQPEMIDLDDDVDEISTIVLDKTPDNSLITIDLDTTLPINLTRLNNLQGQKRKCLFSDDNEIEVVDILDDDVIVLDESSTTENFNTLKQTSNSGNQSSPGLHVTLFGENRSVCHIPVSNPLAELKTPVQPGAKTNKVVSPANNKKKSSGSKKKKNKKKKNLNSMLNSRKCKVIDLKVSETYSNELSTDSSKRQSRLSYRRLAHLNSPLTQSMSTDQAVQEMDCDSNVYNPNSGLDDKKGLRPIVIDGNNVAVGHGKGRFSLKGIQICINYFEKRGHRHIKAFIPQYRKNKETHETITNMERQGTAAITPSRRIEGRVVASYDDRFIVQYATEFDGVIVTTDNYRDLLIENPKWKDTIEKRLLMFTWVDDLLMFPRDPLGRNGPTLDRFLEFSGH